MALRRQAEIRSSIPAMKIVVAAETGGSCTAAAVPVAASAAAGPHVAYGVPAVTARIASMCGASSAASRRAASAVMGGS
jgi:hypothetical protein